MATSRSSAHLKERKVPSSSSAQSADTLHRRPSPKSSLPSSPERETTRPTQSRPRTSPATGISRTAKNQQPSSGAAAAAPSRRITATRKPSDQKPLSSSLQAKHLSSSLQPRPSSASHTSRQPSSATVKERTPRTSTSSVVRTGTSSKPIIGTSKTAKPVRSGTTQPSVRAKSTRSIAKDKEPIAKPPCRSTSEEPIAVPEPEEHEEESADHAEEINDSISVSSAKDYDSDDMKDTPETSVSEAVGTESLSEQSEQHEAKPLEQDPEPAVDDDDGSQEDGSEEHGDVDIGSDPAGDSDEKQDAETVEEQEDEPQETEQKPVADAEELSKDPSAEPIAVAEPEKETEERETEKTVVRVMTFKKPEVVQGWKNDTPKNNEVLEEARSKLLERKKSKVLALVGAFETVMSLQEPEGQTQESSESKEVKKDDNSA